MLWVGQLLTFHDITVMSDTQLAVITKKLSRVGFVELYEDCFLPCTNEG